MANYKSKTAGIRGASGLVGSAVAKSLKDEGWMVTNIGREFSANDLKGLDVVINLAGRSINCRWNSSQRREIIKSRIQTTSKLVSAIKECGSDAPTLLISASATGIYPSSYKASPDNAFNEETTERGVGFLAETCVAWESEALKASRFTRVVIARLGVVISTEGGALPKLTLPFRMGVSVRFGKGTQPLSWISLYDVTEAVKFIIKDTSLVGPVNLVSPQIIDMNGVNSTLSARFKTKISIYIPESMLKIAMGGSHRLVTEGQNVKPEKLLTRGFQFKNNSFQTSV